MRTKLELWQLVDHHFDEHFFVGLCSVIMGLRYVGLININEWISIMDEIAHFGSTNEFFLGKKGDAKPRKEFIQNRIKQYKNEN